MKKLLIILLALIWLTGSAQVSDVKVRRIADATTTFAENLSIGNQIYNIATGELWVATAAVISTATLTTASGSFDLINSSGGVSGSGTSDTLTKFTGTSTVGNSGITENGTTVDFGALDLTSTGSVTHAAPTLSTHSALKSTVTDAVSGTDGFISNFDGTDALENSPIFTDGASVGIGTASPIFSLQVAHDSRITDDGNVGLAITGKTDATLRLLLGYDATDDIAYIQSIDAGAAYKNLILQNNGGDIGIGVKSPDTKVEILNAGNQLKLSFDGTDNATFGVDTNGDLTITNSGTKTIFTDDIELNEDLIDINGSTGTAAQVLSSLGAGLGVDWVDASGGGSGDMLASVYDAAAITEQLVGLTASQTLTNKTFSNPLSISGVTNYISFTSGGYIRTFNLSSAPSGLTSSTGAIWHKNDGHLWFTNNTESFDLTAGGVTDLSVTGTVSPLTLNSSDGTDVTFTAGTNITLAGTSSNITINASSGGTTDLSLGTITATTIDVNSSTGTNATLLEANTTQAGILGSDKWDEIVANSTFRTTPSTAITAGTNISWTGNTLNVTGSAGTVTSVATTAPITGGTITETGTIGITQSNTTTDGYLSSTDWNTFNNKVDGLWTDNGTEVYPTNKERIRATSNAGNNVIEIVNEGTASQGGYWRFFGGVSTGTNFRLEHGTSAGTTAYIEYLTDSWSTLEPIVQEDYTDMRQISSPSAPAASYARIYPKTDGTLNMRTSSNSETPVNFKTRQALTSSAAVAMDFLDGSKASFTLTTNGTITISNIPDGEDGIITVTNGATPYTLAVAGGTGFTTERIFGSNAVIDATASSVTKIVYERVDAELHISFIYEN